MNKVYTIVGYIAIVVAISSFILLFFIGCSNMNTLSVKPSTTTVIYGQDTSTAEKDAKNDVLTDTEKKSWSIKQVFKWE
jgi:hypothetical protein